MAEFYYRRRLPHWRIDHAIYFVTWRLAAGEDDLAPFERDLVVSALRHFDGERYQLSAFVVMNDHVHLLVSMLEPFALEQVLHTWKSFTAARMQRECGRRGPVCQTEYFERVVRDEREFAQKFNYIQGNPGVRWPELRNYRWLWPAST